MAGEKEGEGALGADEKPINADGFVNLGDDPNGPPQEPVEVVLGGDDAGTDKDAAAEGERDAEEESEEGKRKEAKRRKEGVARQRERAREAENRMTAAERRAAELEAENERLKAGKSQSDLAAMTHFKRATEAAQREAQQELRAAKEAGDTDAEVKAQTKLAEASAELNNIKAWEARQPKPDAKTKPNGKGDDDEEGDERPKERKGDERRAPVKLAPDTQAWVEANAWFEPGSEDFDPDLHDAAVSIGRTLEIKLRKQGRADEIGSAAYFKEIDRQMKDFMDEKEDEGEREEEEEKPARAKLPTMKAGDRTVSGHSRTLSSGATLTTGKDGKRRVTLTPEHREIAQQLAKQGALMTRDEKTGGMRRATVAEAESVYAQKLVEDDKVRNTEGRRA